MKQSDACPHRIAAEVFVVACALWLMACAGQNALPAAMSAPSPTLSAILSASATVTPTPQPLPRLYTDGPYLRRADTNKAVQLKGIEITEFLDQDKPSLEHILSMGLQKLTSEQWRINLLRIAIVYDLDERYWSELERLITYADVQGWYVILTPHASQKDPEHDEFNTPVPDGHVVSIMSRFAALFRDHANVLFGLWNEPHPEDSPYANQDYDRAWRQWIDAGVRVASGIRRANPDALIVVPGGRKWARDLSYYQSVPFPFSNVLYDVHDYAAAPEYGYTRDMWTWIIGKYPLIINEFGGACCEWSDPPLQSQGDIDYMLEDLQIVNAHPNTVHYTMWAMDSGGDMTAIFLRPNLDLMPRGQLLAYDLWKYPPTQFRP